MKIEVKQGDMWGTSPSFLVQIRGSEWRSVGKCVSDWTTVAKPANVLPLDPHFTLSILAGLGHTVDEVEDMETVEWPKFVVKAPNGDYKAVCSTLESCNNFAKASDRICRISPPCSQWWSVNEEGRMVPFATKAQRDSWCNGNWKPCTPTGEVTK